MGYFRGVHFRARTGTPRRWLRRPTILAGIALAVLLTGGILFILHNVAADTPVPADVRKDVNFSIYYPQQSKLPTGYSLDATTFRLAQPGVIIYSVRTGNQQLVFSEEATPDGNIVDKFVSSYIPLHNTVTTKLGKAAVGAAGQGTHMQTIISLPITNGPWLIITAPSDTKQSDIQQILQSLTK